MKESGHEEIANIITDPKKAIYENVWALWRNYQNRKLKSHKNDGRQGQYGKILKTIIKQKNKNNVSEKIDHFFQNRIVQILEEYTSIEKVSSMVELFQN